MNIFDQAYVLERYDLTSDELEYWIEGPPVGFPKPHVIAGEHYWTGEELAAWDNCSLLNDIKGHAEAAQARLEELLDRLAEL